MDVDIKIRNHNQNQLILAGMDVPFVNAVRRICMVEVPTMAIETVQIYKNESRLFDEVLAHRLGLIPLKTDLESIVPREECDCEDHCPRCSVSFILKEKGPKVVHSGDLTSEDPKVTPVQDAIPIMKLREGEEVELEAIAQLGSGKEHAKWQPTTTCAYQNYPRITIDTDKCEVCGKCAEECPRGVLELDEEKNQIIVVNLENCSLCNTCVKDCEAGAVKVEGEKDKFIFNIETDGSLSPEEVLKTACDILVQKSDKIITFCKGGS